MVVLEFRGKICCFDGLPGKRLREGEITKMHNENVRNHPPRYDERSSSPYSIAQLGQPATYRPHQTIAMEQRISFNFFSPNACRSESSVVIFAVP
jgi:hypothetical protein